MQGLPSTVARLLSRRESTDQHRPAAAAREVLVEPGPPTLGAGSESSRSRAPQAPPPGATPVFGPTWTLAPSYQNLAAY